MRDAMICFSQVLTQSVTRPVMSLQHRLPAGNCHPAGRAMHGGDGSARGRRSVEEATCRGQGKETAVIRGCHRSHGTSAWVGSCSL